MFPLKQWLFRVLIAKLFRTPIIWWSVGINVAESTKGYLPFLFRGKKTIVTVRDKKSREVLASLGIEGAILPDPVLGYE
jgi:polysaccharide pyruvyl transferase WcaK-like protein